MAAMSACDEQKQLTQTVERKEKKHRLVEKAIPNIANAIQTVVKVSKNENFKEKCFNLFKVNDEDEFSKAITKSLWNIATSKLNVKSCDDGDSQIVPGIKGIKPPVCEVKNKAALEIAQIDALNGGSSEDYFDDLAGELTFYEDLCSQKNCPSDHETTDAVEPQDMTQKPSSVPNAQELSCSANKPDRDKPLITSAFTSPKAKLRCCENTSPPTSSNDWLQEFTQDLFWMESDERTATNTMQNTLDCNVEEQIDETAHHSRLLSDFQGGEDGDIFLECTRKSQLLSAVTDSSITNTAINEISSNNDPGYDTCHPKHQDTLSSTQSATSSDDFDALGELSFI